MHQNHPQNQPRLNPPRKPRKSIAQNLTHNPSVRKPPPLTETNESRGDDDKFQRVEASGPDELVNGDVGAFECREAFFVHCYDAFTGFAVGGEGWGEGDCVDFVAGGESHGVEGDVGEGAVVGCPGGEVAVVFEVADDPCLGSVGVVYVFLVDSLTESWWSFCMWFTMRC